MDAIKSGLVTGQSPFRGLCEKFPITTSWVAEFEDPKGHRPVLQWASTTIKHDKFYVAPSSV